MASIREKTISGVKWSAVEKVSVQVIQFVIGIILARLLSPSDYGVVGVLGIFMAISGTFIDGGFGSALIRKNDRTDLDCTTVFYFNLAVSLVCYLILFLCAPWIAAFFKMPILVKVVRVYCLSLVIGALGTVQFTRLTIAIDFRKIAMIHFITTIISGGIGVLLAYLGFGAWALVAQSLSLCVLRTAFVWVLTKWHPTLNFSKKSFKDLFAFGGNITLSGLLNTIANNLTSIIIGRFFSAADLGFYSKGNNTAALPANTINDILGRVTYPILATIQNDDDKLIRIYRKYIRSTSLVVVFLSTLVAALGKPIVIFLYTDKWMGSVIYLQLIAFAIMFDHVCRLNLSLLYVKGRSDYVLRLEIIKKTISIAMLLVSVHWGIIGICVSRILYTQIAIIFNTYYTGKIYNLGYWKQMGDFVPYLFFSLFACVPAYLLTFTELPAITVIICGGIVSSLIYLAILLIKKDSILEEYAAPIFSKYFKVD